MKIKEVFRTLFGGSIVYVLMAACSGVTNSPTGGGSTGQAGHGGAGGMATSSIGGFGGMGQTGSGGLGGMGQTGSGGLGGMGQTGSGGLGGMSQTGSGGFGGMSQSGSGGFGGMSQTGSGGFGGMSQTGSGGFGGMSQTGSGGFGGMSQSGSGGFGGMAQTGSGGFGGMSQSGSGGFGGMAQTGSGGFGGMAQTGSGGMGQGGSIFDAGGIWDALTDPVPDASADPISGTRLKAKYRMGADGSKEYINGTWFDSQRNEDCSFATAMDGQLRCMPISWQANFGLYNTYADASCTKPVAYVSNTCTPKYATEYNYSVCSATGSAVRLYSLGAQLSTTYQKSGTNCVVGTPTPGYKFYSLGAEVPPSSFVSATIGIDP